jgi:hypothetical protein
MVYVDNIILIGGNLVRIHILKQTLSSPFHMSLLGLH